TRFLPNGELDTGFGIEGTVASPVDAASAIITRAQMRDDGKIFAVGYGIPDLLYSDTFIASFNADGTLNNDFGTDGIVWIDISTSSFFSFDIALQPDDKILFIGTYTDDVSGDTNMGIGRLNADGTVDETFASGGFLTIDMDGNDESGSAMHLQMDNKILIAGHTNASGHRNFVVMRLESNGDMDNLWGIDGMVTTDFAGADDKALDITLQADDKIIAAGQVNDGGLRIGMARYKNDTDIGTELQTNIFNRISLYPNPATSVLNIYLQNTEFKNAAITISNVYGQKVRVTAITSKEGHLQVYLPADMAGGLYFLMVELNGKMYNVAFEKM
ncbi:MAG: T9SS type A sorting domain-containing protein, partial [Chitinophagales bacterium]